MGRVSSVQISSGWPIPNLRQLRQLNPAFLTQMMGNLGGLRGSRILGMLLRLKEM